jgi:hypothetical protein
VSPVKYEMDFVSQKTEFFIVAAVKPSNLAFAIHYLNCNVFCVISVLIQFIFVRPNFPEEYYVPSEPSKRIPGRSTAKQP